MICKAVMPSDTLARKAQQLLNANGFSVEVIRNSGSRDGCGFALRIAGNCAAAQRLLDRAGITVRSMKTEGDDA